MAFRTFDGPVLLGTSRYGSTRNTGLVQVAQSSTVLGSTASGNCFIIPAGAMLLNAQMLVTTTFNGTTPTVALSIGATPITAAGAAGTAGLVTLTCAATTAAAALWVNVGSTDVTVTYTVAGTTVTSGTAVVQVEYMVADVSGAQFPSSAGSSSTTPGP